MESRKEKGEEAQKHTSSPLLAAKCPHAAKYSKKTAKRQQSKSKVEHNTATIRQKYRKNIAKIQQKNSNITAKYSEKRANVQQNRSKTALNRC